MKMIHDIRKVFNAHLITLITGTVIGFILPALLPVGQYAEIKTFSLYLSLIGIFHFGFVDGVFLKYGGKKAAEIDKQSLVSEKRFLFWFQLLLTLLLVIAGLKLENNIVLAFALSLLPANMIAFYQFIYQALGEFSLYARIMYVTSFGNLIIPLILIALKVKSSLFYISGMVIIYYIVYLALERFNPFKQHSKIKWDFADYKQCFYSGIFILISNFSMLLFYTMDRWFVKLYFDTKSFAFYSFAISMMTAVNVLIGSLTTTMYPYLARIRDSDKLCRIRDYLLILGTFVSGSIFIFSFIVNHFITEYVHSLNIITILFAGFPAIIIVNVLFINLYKVEKKQKKYLIIVSILLVVSALAIIITVHLFHNYLSVAFVTVLAFYIWFFYSTHDFTNIQHSSGIVLYLFSFLVLYSVTTYYCNDIAGIIIYYPAMAVITYFFIGKRNPWSKMRD
ncbi:oligosaccharide flippase family protein [Sporolactobacillus sp. Y61]|uniref:Oligosaccharide flippase family protein n=1 Tax=Sporolactobacillus sp. Y61 TaxID=3160863 RepID=A0AAU8II56_9BACL